MNLFEQAFNKIVNKGKVNERDESMGNYIKSINNKVNHKEANMSKAEAKVNNNNVKKGSKMMNVNTTKPDTLYGLYQRIENKKAIYTKAAKEIASRVFVADKKTGEMTDEHKSQQAFLASIQAELDRLDWAQYLINQEAKKDGVNGSEKYILELAVVKNDNKAYPGQNYESLFNSTGLMRAVAYEIRHTIVEDEFTQKQVGYYQRDARELKAVVEANKKKLSKRAYKIGYILTPAS